MGVGRHTTNVTDFNRKTLMSVENVFHYTEMLDKVCKTKF